MRVIAAVAAAVATALPIAAPTRGQVRAFTLAGPAVPGSVAVTPGRAFADGYGYGYEPVGGGALFSVAEPPGNYRVTVTLGLPDRTSRATIKAESRRLMIEGPAVPAGGTATRSFVVNVRDATLASPAPGPGGGGVGIKPREQGSYTWDDRLTLEMLGDPAGVRAIRIAPVTVPTVFLLGDSTVTDQRAEPAASWGQMLPVFLRPDIAVANHAESGETMMAFVAERRLAKVLELAKPGDFALIQFGHNDQKKRLPTYLAAETGYRDYLRRFIVALRQRGVEPILVTSPERRFWDGTRIRPTLAEYAAAARAVGAEEKLPVIDLEAATIRFYEALGPARAPLAFNDHGKDATHHDNYGAWVLARIVAEAIRGGVPALAVHLRDDIGRFDPASPPDPVRFRLAPSVGYDATRPEGS